MPVAMEVQMTGGARQSPKEIHKRYEESDNAAHKETDDGKLTFWKILTVVACLLFLVTLVSLIILLITDDDDNDSESCPSNGDTFSEDDDDNYCTFGPLYNWNVYSAWDTENIEDVTLEQCRKLCCEKDCTGFAYATQTRVCSTTQLSKFKVLTTFAFVGSQNHILQFRNAARVRKNINALTPTEEFFVVYGRKLLKETTFATLNGTNLVINGEESSTFTVNIDMSHITDPPKEGIYEISYAEWLAGMHGPLFWKEGLFTGPNQDKECSTTDQNCGVGMCGLWKDPVYLDFFDGSDECCPHGDLRFPAWHRLYQVAYEETTIWMLSREFPDYNFENFGYPYWDWTNDNFPGLFKQTEVCFPNVDQCKEKFPNSDDCCIENAVMSGPVLSWHLGEVCSECERDPQYEKYDYFTNSSNPNSFYSWTMEAMRYRFYEQFEYQFEVPHNEVHNWMGSENCHCCCMQSNVSPNDAIFFFIMGTWTDCGRHDRNWT
eukprot:UN22695